MIGGTWQTTAPDRSLRLSVARVAAAMVVLPVFLQAPWVRLHPFSAAVFTAVLVAVGVVLGRSADEQRMPWDSCWWGSAEVGWLDVCSGGGCAPILCSICPLKPSHYPWQWGDWADVGGWPAVSTSPR